MFNHLVFITPGPLFKPLALSMYRLSPGSCQRLYDTGSSDDPVLIKPHILQILSIKLLNSTTANNVDRYRTIMSDGVHYIRVMLATRLNQYVQEKQIHKYSVIAIDRMTWNRVQERSILIALALRVLGSPDNKIGDPKSISPEGIVSMPNSTVGSMTPSFEGLGNTPLVQQQNQAIQNPQLSGYDPHTNSIYPMEPLCSCLNEDILREIFIRCVSDHGNDSKCFILDDSKPLMRDYPQFTVSRVCSLWRHIALLTPQLWNNVMIQYLTESNLTIATKYLSHARNLPISITLGPYIVMQDWPGHSQLTDFLSSYQLRELVVSTQIPHFGAVLRDLPQRSVEDLELLGMFHNYDPEEVAIDLNDNRYPKLTSVAMAGAYEISGCSSSLRVFDGTGVLMTVIESWDLLSRLPSLEEARLRVDGNHWQRWLPKPQIHHQRLRTLILQLKFGGEIPFSIFVEALALPSLEKMHVFNSWSATALQSLAQRSNHFPNLSDFLLGITTSDVNAGTLLASMPSITSVSLQCYPSNAVFDQQTLNELASGSLAPRLQNLMGCISSGKEFMDMVETRMRNARMSNNDVPAPFTKVEVPFHLVDGVSRLFDMQQRGIPIYRWFL